MKIDGLTRLRWGVGVWVYTARSLKGCSSIFLMPVPSAFKVSPLRCSSEVRALESKGNNT